MKKKFIIVLCTALPLAAVAAIFHRRSHRKYLAQ